MADNILQSDVFDYYSGGESEEEFSGENFNEENIVASVGKIAEDKITEDKNVKAETEQPHDKQVMSVNIPVQLSAVNTQTVHAMAKSRGRVLSISVITSGRNIYKHGILSVGLCFSDSAGLTKKQFNMVLEIGQSPIDKTKLTKNENLSLRDLINGAALPKDKIPQLVAFVKSLAGDSAITTIFNDYHEISFLNYYISKYSDYTSLREINSDIFLLDISAYCQGVCCCDVYQTDAQLLAKLNIPSGSAQSSANTYKPTEIAESRLTFYNNVMERARDFAMG